MPTGQMQETKVDSAQPLSAIVSLLDERHKDRVEEIWSELVSRFGIQNVAVAPYPHFSYHVAQSYDLEAASTVLARFAQNSGSFRVSSSGLGVFTGPRPVLYVPLVRNAALARLHRELWLAIDRTAQGTLAYYHPENWIPHITLAQEKLDQRTLSEILGWLCGQDFAWDFPVNNLSLIHSSDGMQELHCCFEW